MTNDLIISIGKQLNIPRSDDNEWVCQIVYSVAGQMALASLWDHGDGGDSISIQHFKSRIAQIFDAYGDIYPEIKFLLPEDRTILIDEIYSIYLRNGFFYHSAYQIVPAAPVASTVGNLTLYRGNSPDLRLFMSGLGFYSTQKSDYNGNVEKMFCLQDQTFEIYLEEQLDSGEWEVIDWPNNTEFLRLEPPFTRGYWKQIPDNDGRISLARYGEPNKIFVFYRYDNEICQYKPIPEWRIRDYFSNDTGSYGEYRRIAIALLNRYGTIPEGLHKSKALIMIISRDYLESVCCTDEWGAFYGKTLHDNSCVIYPIIIDDSQPPALISQIKYLRFDNNEYSSNLSTLLKALSIQFHKHSVCPHIE